MYPRLSLVAEDPNQDGHSLGTTIAEPPSSTPVKEAVLIFGFGTPLRYPEMVSGSAENLTYVISPISILIPVLEAGIGGHPKYASFLFTLAIGLIYHAENSNMVMNTETAISKRLALG